MLVLTFIHDDGNGSIYLRKLTYDFISDYKGQYVTLGKIGYSIMDDPKVSAANNGKEKTDITVEKQTMLLNSKSL